MTNRCLFCCRFLFILATTFALCAPIFLAMLGAAWLGHREAVLWVGIVAALVWGPAAYAITCIGETEGR